MSPRILVVDDEPSLVRGLTYALERDKFEVRGRDRRRGRRRRGADPGDRPRDPRPDAPEALGRGGLPADPGARATCRSSCSPRRTPSASCSTGLELGADDYVTKPFSAAELIGRVSRAAPPPRSSTTPRASSVVRTVGAIKIDLVRDEVSVEGKPVVADAVGVQDPRPARRRARRGLHAAADHGAPLGQHASPRTSTPARCTSRRCAARSSATPPRPSAS